MSTKRHSPPGQQRILPERPPRLDRSGAAKARNPNPCEECHKSKIGCIKMDGGCYACLKKETLCSYEGRNHDKKGDIRSTRPSSPEVARTNGELVRGYETNDEHMTTDTRIKSDVDYDSSVVINGDNTNRMDPRDAAQPTDGFPAPGCKSGFFGHMKISFGGNESTIATFVHCDPDGTLHYGAVYGDLDWNILNETPYLSEVGPSDVFGKMFAPYASGDHTSMLITNDSTVYAGREHAI